MPRQRYLAVTSSDENSPANWFILTNNRTVSKYSPKRSFLHGPRRYDQILLDRASTTFVVEKRRKADVTAVSESLIQLIIVTRSPPDGEAKPDATSLQLKIDAHNSLFVKSTKPWPKLVLDLSVLEG